MLSVALLFPALLFSQNNNLTHSVGIYMGYANRSAMNGMSLQCQYALGVCPHLDVLASVAFVNVYDKEGFSAHNVNAPIMSYMNFFNVGVRTYVDFLKICSFKVSGKIGVNTDYQYVLSSLNYSYPIGLFCFNADAMGELVFNVSPKLDLGIYYEYAYMFGRTVVNPHIHKAGLLLNLKL